MEYELKPINADLFKLTREAFLEGFRKIQEQRTQNKYIGTYSNWPSINYFDNGLPRFSEYSFNPAPKDYKSVFGKNSDWQISYTELHSYQNLLSYARANEELNKYFAWTDQKIPNELFDFSIWYFVEKLLDRYIHLFPDITFIEERFTQIYCPLEASIYEKTLSVDVIVPILFLKFDFDKYILSSTILIEKMEEDFQLSRISKRAFSPSVNTLVLGAATHALVLKGWSITNTNDRNFSTNISEIAFYQKPLEQVDAFFASLRITQAIDSGYAQVLLRPLNWATNYIAHLPALEGTSLRRYPYWFENYYWLQPIRVFSATELDECAKFYHQLINIENNRMRIAVRRLNRCYLREGEEDSILDATIAMEALLSDDDRQEMTHKLALRIAALSSLASNQTETPVEVFNAVKQIYRYRSKIVHGSTKSDKGREIVLSANKRVPTVKLAIDYLRMLLTVLIQHQEYFKPANIDEMLLLSGKVNI